jgi:hypothetical protein
MRLDQLVSSLFLIAGVALVARAAGAAPVHLQPGASFEAAVESLEPGDTLIVHGGTYSESGRISITVKGTPAAPVAIIGAAGESPPLITRPAGAKAQNTINIEGATHLTIKGLEISSNGGDGVNLNSSPSHITLEDLHIHDIHVGVNFRSDMDHITVRRCHIHDTNGTGEGMYVGCNHAKCRVSDSLLEGNWIHDTKNATQGDGIEIKRGSYNNVIRDNVIHDTRFPCILLYGTEGKARNVVEGNVMWSCGDSGIQVAADAVVRNNIILDSPANGLNSQPHQEVTPKDLELVHNTIVGGSPCVRIASWANQPGMVFANNAIYCASGGFKVASLAGVTVTGNVFSPAAPAVFLPAGYLVGGAATDDMVAPAQKDVYPKPGSKLVDAGDAKWQTAVDFNGTPRTGQPEAGAYTFAAAGNPGWSVAAGFKGSTAAPPADGGPAGDGRPTADGPVADATPATDAPAAGDRAMSGASGDDGCTCVVGAGPRRRGLALLLALPWLLVAIARPGRRRALLLVCGLGVASSLLGACAESPDARRGDAGRPPDGSAQPDSARQPPDAAPPLTNAEVTRVEGGVRIAFTVPAPTDVEVSVLDSAGVVVRHLAAGVLGGKSPPPAPLVAGLSQSVVWDERDDHDEPVTAPGTCTVRIRTGMGTSLESIVGGDPYAYFSGELNRGNHTAWRMSGMELKSDGKVYVLGNASFIGPPALRQYDADGNYLKTVFPPPAGKPLEEVQGWGVNVRDDGTYCPRHRDLGNPTPTTSYVPGRGRGTIGDLIPSPDKDTLVISDTGLNPTFRLMTINTDGTIPASQDTTTPLVSDPSMFHPQTDLSYPLKAPWFPGGPFFTALSHDGASLYLGGHYARTNVSGSAKGAEATGFWRDGQVFKIDRATGKATSVYALGKVITGLQDRIASPIGSQFSASAIHGVAEDAKGRLFISDRQRGLIVVLGNGGQILRELEVDYPDAVAVSKATGALYVTTRFGDDHHHGPDAVIKLLKFADWQTATAPSSSIKLCDVFASYANRLRSLLLAVDTPGGVNVWVAYKDMSPRIYRDSGGALTLLRDFHETGQRQRCLDLGRIAVDAARDTVYVADSFSSMFRVEDWKAPRLEPCETAAGSPVKGNHVAIDERRHHLYASTYKAWEAPINRYAIGSGALTPLPLSGGSNAIAPTLLVNWMIGYGKSTAGFDVSPDGRVAMLTRRKGAAAASLAFFALDKPDPLWEVTALHALGAVGCVRFDPRGNLYVGVVDKAPANIPAGFAADPNYKKYVGRIHRYAPTGSLKQGDLFPSAPTAPAAIYDVHFGDLGGRSFKRPSLFAVDPFGRIAYPNSLAAYVGLIDNAGNEILRFGTYGNRDSTGGLPGDLVPTGDIPMAYPKSVGLTDEHIYVSDMVNVRLLRIRKTFATVTTLAVP